MSRTITVKGTATVSAPSEITVVRATLSGKEWEYKDAMNELAQMTKDFKDAVETAGIPRVEIKTSALSIQQSYRDQKIGEDKNGYDRFKKVPDGYTYSQDVIFEFENDSSKLTRALENIMRADITPVVHFSYKAKDPVANDLKALSEAAKNAKAEAETIVGSVGCRLGKLLSVSRESSHFRYDDDDDYGRCFSLSSDCEMTALPDLDVDPEDSQFSRAVTMTWEIED